MKTNQVHTLLIRHCKRNKFSLFILRRIIGKLYGYKGIDDETIIRALISFCDKYSLVKDWKRFFLAVNPDEDVWWGGEKKEWQRAIIDDLVQIISCTEVSVFGDYAAPAYYRHFEARGFKHAKKD